MNLQLSCSFFLQGEGTPNGRQRERTGRWYVLDVVWEAPDGALWEIAVADGNCSGIAAQTDEAGIGSSKTIAAVPATSAGALGYGVHRGCGREAQRRLRRNLRWWCRVEASSALPKLAWEN